jgi:hypothetical protein
MLWIARFLAVAFGAAAFFAPAFAAQNPTAGVVLEADHTLTGNAPVTAGASVFSGDVLNTDSEGHAQVRIGQTRFQLLPNTEAAFLSSERGPVAELRRGSLIVSDNASQTFRVYASDVLVAPTSDRPILGQITIESPCEVKIASEHGRLEATVGRETKTIEEQHSYSVRPEYSVRDTRMPAISPDDDAFHRGHNHATCAAAPQHHALKVPVVPSHFTLLVGGGIGIITVIGVKEALESPDRP